MKTKMYAKKLLTTLTMLLMCVLLVVSFTACKEKDKEDNNDATKTTSTNADASIWADAIYTEDTVIGKGSTTFYFETKVGTHSVTFTVNTDKKTVGEALLENNIIAGEDGYVKTVNGILADYDVNATFWGFYQDGEYMMTGVDTTEIESGAHYEMVYEKG